MPSDLIANSSSVPNNGEYVLPFFAPNGSQAFDFYSPFWYMENGWESIGPTEDEMTFRIQADGKSNYAFDIVLNPNGILGVIKFGCPVVAVRYYITDDGVSAYDVIFAGFVQDIRQKSEGLTQWVQVRATSVKNVLRNIKIRGSYCWDGTQVVYRDATPLHMNRGGRPDWTFSDDGIAMPAINPDWGLAADEEPPLADDQDTTKATYCTLGMLTQYLREFYSAEISANQGVEDARDLARQYYSMLDCLPSGFPFNFVWPDTFGQEVDQNIVNNFNNAVGQNNQSVGGARKGREITFRNGQPLIGNSAEMGVLDTIFQECGGFNYCLDYGSLFENDDGSINIILQTVPTRVFNSQQSLPLYYAAGSEANIGSLFLVRELDYLESNAGTFTRLAGIGSSVKVERRAAINQDNDEAAIFFGFTEEDFEGFRADSVASGQTSEELMYKALKNYPHLFSRFLFDPTQNPATGTEYEDYPYAQAVRPVWPFLLSYQGANLSTEANDIVPYPVRVEVDTADDGEFVDAQIEQDGFVSWDNGYFEFLTFRDVGINRGDVGVNGRRGMFTWNNGWGAVVNEGGVDKLDISLNNIRCTVAIPIDATINYSLKTPADKRDNGDNDAFDNADDSPDALRFDSEFSRPIIVDLSRLYDLWLRIQSYPVPESAGGEQFEDKTTLQNAVRSDYILLQQNCQKSLYERNRLQRSGFFKFVGHLIPPQVYPLGQQISEIRPFDNAIDVNPFPLNCCIQMKKWATKNLGTPASPKWSSSTEIVPI